MSSFWSLSIFEAHSYSHNLAGGDYCITWTKFQHGHDGNDNKNNCDNRIIAATFEWMLEFSTRQQMWLLGTPSVSLVALPDYTNGHEKGYQNVRSGTESLLLLGTQPGFYYKYTGLLQQADLSFVNAHKWNSRKWPFQESESECWRKRIRTKCWQTTWPCPESTDCDRQYHSPNHTQSIHISVWGGEFQHWLSGHM